MNCDQSPIQDTPLIDAANVNRPRWLEAIGDTGRPKRVPVKELLDGSLYYPASGLDGCPVKRLARHISSFIYCDYSIDTTRILQGLGTTQQLRGYELHRLQHLAWGELAPDEALREIPPPETGQALGTFAAMHGQSSYDAVWTVWHRHREFPPAHGMEWLSWLFVMGEACIVFRGLYRRNFSVPSVVTILQGGGALGGGWENHESRRSWLAESVINNRAGMPRYLLVGGNHIAYGDAGCWGYDVRVRRVVRSRHRAVSLWTR